MGWLDRIFGRKKPTPPKLPQGNRGVAMGSRKKPTLQSYEQRLKRGQEVIPSSEVEDYIYNNQPLFVNSSNVSMIQYFPESSQLMIEYKDGAAYLYDQISQDEALRFATVQSKGSEVWDALRVRGTVYGARKPYRKLRG